MKGWTHNLGTIFLWEPAERLRIISYPRYSVTSPSSVPMNRVSISYLKSVIMSFDLPFPHRFLKSNSVKPFTLKKDFHGFIQSSWRWGISVQRSHHFIHNILVIGSYYHLGSRETDWKSIGQSLLPSTCQPEERPVLCTVVREFCGCYDRSGLLIVCGDDLLIFLRWGRSSIPWFEYWNTLKLVSVLLHIGSPRPPVKATCHTVAYGEKPHTTNPTPDRTCCLSIRLPSKKT